MAVSSLHGKSSHAICHDKGKATYRNNRFTGVTIVFKATDAGFLFWKVNSNAPDAAVVSATQENVLTQCFNKVGSLMVCVASLEAANILLYLNSMTGIHVSVRVP